MDSLVLESCLDIFDITMSTPLGLLLSTYFTPIREKLLAKEFQSLNGYLTEIQQTVSLLVREYSLDSDISMALLTLRDMIIENSKQMLCADEKVWKCSKDSLIKRLRDYYESLNEERISNARIVKSASMEDLQIPEPDLSHVDLEKLKSMIEQLITDEEEYDVFKLVQKFEPSFAKVRSRVHVDLRKLYPETIIKIWEYTTQKQKKVELPKPVLAEGPFLIDLTAHLNHSPKPGRDVIIPKKSFSRDALDEEAGS